MNSRLHKLCWLSSYDRGLEYLLYIWSDIKKEFPDATLDIAYGWQTFDKLTIGNPERLKWKQGIQTLMNQPGITHHGRIGKKALSEIRRHCGILAYSTDFFEIDCITVKECQSQGCVPVAMNQEYTLDTGEKVHSALNETVYAGILVDGMIKTPEGMNAYTKALLDLMHNQDRWKDLSDKGKKGAAERSWEKMALKWTPLLEAKPRDITVSVITPTIRKGFWDVMADVLAKQTHPITEWIIVDDYPEDRSTIAQETAEKYKLKIVYLRGTKKDKRYHYSLSSANNIGAKAATGELLVFLQDFIFPSQHGIEALVDLHRHNPDALLAPVDVTYFPKEQPAVDTEKWFGDQKYPEFVGELYWTNNRILDIGIRESDHPFEWEMNYGAIPKKIWEALGGWYEFYNDGLGFDNTEIAYRALKKGYRIIVDDTNVAVGVDHWKSLEGDMSQLGEKRTHRLNDPRYFWMIQQIEKGNLGVVRTKEPKRLEYTIPEELDQKQAVTWMREHQDEIIKGWGDV